jgi:hypothetical protein
MSYNYCNEQRDAQEKELKRLEGMTVEQLQVVLDERLKESIIEAIQKLPQAIDAKISTASWHIICAAIGVKKDSWHDSKWEVDSHNEKSAIARELGEHALTAIKHAIPDFTAGMVESNPRIPPIKSAYTRAFKSKLAELIDRKIWEVAEKSANRRFTEIMEKLGGETVDPLDDEE